MGNSYTEHSKRLRGKTANDARKKAIAEGRIKRKTFIAPPEVIETFMAHLASVGSGTEAERLKKINEILNEALKQK